MPNAFDTEFAAQAWPLLKAQFGRTIIHRPLGVEADGVEITAIVHLDKIAEQDHTDFTGPRRMRMGRLEVDAAVEVTAGLEHRPRDTVLIDDELWGLRQSDSKNGVFKSLQIERYSDPTGSPPG